MSKIEKKRKNLKNLFMLAKQSPEEAQEDIEQLVKAPYTRSQAGNLTEDSIDNLNDYQLKNYYNAKLYDIWNYAERIKNGRG